MKTIDKEIYIFLIMLWGFFLIWEYEILIASDSATELGIRYDLLVLPILFISTVYTLRRKR